MRHPRVVRVLLAIFGIVPVAAWLAIASSLDPSGLGRNIGLAILVLLSPLPFGGLLMVTGAAIVGRRPRAGRIVATVGAAIVSAGTAVLAAVWAHRFAACGGPSGACTGEMVEAIAGFVYALLHIGLIVFVWRNAGATTPGRA